MTEIKNFIPAYPDPDDPDLIHKLSQLKEFADLKLAPSEEIPDQPGVPLSHQELQARHFAEQTPYDQGVLWHGLGTGKCVMGNTFIRTSDGCRQISSIWDNEKEPVFFDGEGMWKKPDIDISVVSYDENTKRMCYKSVTSLYAQLVDEHIVTITTRDGPAISITKAHHLYDGTDWVKKFEVGGVVCTVTDQFELVQSEIAGISVERYRGLVYDLEVADTHNYVGNDILCHNTCTGSLIAERLKNSMVDGKPRKPALIIVKNSHLRDSFRNEIARVCTRDVYTPKLRKEELLRLQQFKVVELSEDAKRKRLNAAIAKSYTIMTMGELMSKKNMPSDAVIKREFSNRLIIVDEVHNIRVQPTKKDSTQYDALHRFLHTVEGGRVILLTATPIWDTVYDIASLLNLLLPLNDQLPVLDEFTRKFFNRDGELRMSKAAELKAKMRGRISYLRSLISSAARHEIGVKNPWLNYINVYPSMMSDYQSTLSDHAKDAGAEKLDKRGKKIGDAFMGDARDATTCIYPVFDRGVEKQGVYGVSAFEKYAISRRRKFLTKGVDKHGRPKRVESTVEEYMFANEAIKRALGPSDGPDKLSNLRKYSAKFAAVIEMLLDPSRLNEKAFIYSDSVKGTGGVISLALVMQLYGFNWVKSADALPRNGSAPTTAKPGSFVVITSESQTISEPAQIRKTLEHYNRPENMYGPFVRIIIGSKTIAQGHTLKSTRQGHVMMPHWNLPGIDQAMGRIYRAGSFDQLPLDERYVNFYRHVAVRDCDDDDECVTLPTGMSSPDGGTFSTTHTVDTHVYKLAEQKEYLNSQIYRLMKETAWDCSLAYNRNVLESDVEGTRECDFVECNYQCDNFPSVSKTTGPEFMNGDGKLWKYDTPSDSLVATNDNLLYSKGRVVKYTNEIQELFRIYFVLTFDMIIKLLDATDTDKPIILNALNSIINHRVLIRNRYGFGSYLKEDHDTYFLDGSISTFSSYPTSTYTIFPMAVERSTLEDAVEIIQLESDSQKIVEFSKKPRTKTLEAISYRGRIILLEEIVEKGCGDCTIAVIVMRMHERELYTMKDGNIIHNMYNSKYTGSGYNVFTKDLKANGKMRVFDAESRTWDYVLPDLEDSYIDEVKREVSKNLKVGLDDNPYKMYGTVDKAFKFKIFDDRDAKGKTGRVCMTMPASDLWSVFHHLGHLPYDDEIGEGLSKETKDGILTTFEGAKKTWLDTPYMSEAKDMNLDDLRKLYTMLTMSKPSLCASLERWFRGENPEERPLFIEL